jgi:hypothetical protein
MQRDCKRTPDNWTSQTDTVAAGRAANCLQITYFRYTAAPDVTAALLLAIVPTRHGA